MGVHRKGNDGGTVSTDIRTIFVRGVDPSIDEGMLMEKFSAIGPVKRAFLIRKGKSEKHKGYGFVQYALQEDAERSVQEMNGVALGGKKLFVEPAIKRAPLEQRKRKREENPIVSVQEEQDTENKEKNVKSQDEQHGDTDTQALHSKNESGIKSKEGPKMSETLEKHAFVRTIAIGGLNKETADLAIAKARALGAVESVTKLTAKECEEKYGQYKLLQDGCFGDVVFVRYSSVKEAIHAISELHGKTIAEVEKKQREKSKQKVGDFNHNTLWVRQVSGEGMHMKKWRVVVRNLSFKSKESDIRKEFTKAGFVWELTRPCGSDGKPKGFAFIGFCCRAHAERAISLINGTKILDRPVAVDWALSKKEFEAAMSRQNERNIEGVGNKAVEDKVQKTLPKGFGHETEDGDDINQENTGHEREIASNVIDGILGFADGNEDARSNHDAEVYEVDNDESGLKPSSSDASSYEEESDGVSSLDMSSESHSENSEDEEIEAEQNGGSKDIFANEQAGISKSDAVERINKRVERLAESGLGKSGRNQELKEDTLSINRTVFVKGLPLDVVKDQLYQSMKKYGPVKACRLVLQKSTGLPKGTAFVEFYTEEGASAVVKACEEVKSHEGPGVFVAGVRVNAYAALDGDGARALASGKHDEKLDKRNLYLSKEGRILEGSNAWEEMSTSDRNKRLRAASEAKMKLKSPNFRVSSTRLNIRNLPRAWDESKVKGLFIEAVKRHAALSKPKIKQVKILREMGAASGTAPGRSKGIAFVEFTETEHAICALRELNNNPNIWGKEHRPIIEFAIDDVKILKKREARNAAQNGLSNQTPKLAKISSSKNKDKKQTASAEEAQASEGGEKPKSKRKLRQERRQMLKKIKRQQQGKNDSENIENNPEKNTPGKSTKRREQRKRKREEELARNNATGVEDSKPSVKRPNNTSVPKQKQNTDALIDRLAQIDHSNDRPMHQRRRKQPQNKDALDALVDDYTSRTFSNGVTKAQGKSKKKKEKRWFE